MRKIAAAISYVCVRTPAFAWAVIVSGVVMAPVAWPLLMPSEAAVVKLADPVIKDQSRFVPELQPVSIPYIFEDPWVKGVTRVTDPIEPTPVKTIKIEKKKQKRSELPEELIRKASRSALLSYAKANVGKRGPQLGLPGSLWCADFINAMLRRVGLPSTGSRMARSFVSHPKFEKIKAPQPGDIVVIARGRSSVYGHVALYNGSCGKGGIRLLGGNQAGGRVTNQCVSSVRVVGYVRPKTIPETVVARLLS